MLPGTPLFNGVKCHDVNAVATKEKLLMKLYIIRGAPNARKAEAVVHHLGIELAFVELDILSGEHKKEPYLAINPNGLVPAENNRPERLICLVFSTKESAVPKRCAAVV